MKELVMQIVSAYTAIFFFSLLFRLKRPRLWYAVLGGGVTWMVYLVAAQVLRGDFAPCFAASVFATIYAECMARKKKCPVTVFLVPAEIILLPGGNLYYTMSYLVSREYELAMQRGAETLITALAIAAGILVVSTAVPFVCRGKNETSIKNG